MQCSPRRKCQTFAVGGLTRLIDTLHGYIETGDLHEGGYLLLPAFRCSIDRRDAVIDEWLGFDQKADRACLESTPQILREVIGRCTRRAAFRRPRSSEAVFHN